MNAETPQVTLRQSRLIRKWQNPIQWITDKEMPRYATPSALIASVFELKHKWLETTG
jgi:hypothetical protein